MIELNLKTAKTLGLDLPPTLPGRPACRPAERANISDAYRQAGLYIGRRVRKDGPPLTSSAPARCCIRLAKGPANRRDRSRIWHLGRDRSQRRILIPAMFFVPPASASTDAEKDARPSKCWRECCHRRPSGQVSGVGRTRENQSERRSEKQSSPFHFPLPKAYAQQHIDELLWLMIH